LFPDEQKRNSVALTTNQAETQGKRQFSSRAFSDISRRQAEELLLSFFSFQTTKMREQLLTALSELFSWVVSLLPSKYYVGARPTWFDFGDQINIGI
jgi:hypothetical protein